MKNPLILLSLIVLVLVFIWLYPAVNKRGAELTLKPSSKMHRISDEAGVLPQGEIMKFERYIQWIFEESDIDIRFVFLRNTDGRSIEDLAIEKVQELRIGGTNREERGLLLLYDITAQRLRIEVGYGLESYFQDSFISFLVHDHTRDFFSTPDLSLGLRLLLRMLHQRIREAVLGGTYNPKVTELIAQHHFLSGGAGVSSTVASNGQTGVSWQAIGVEEKRLKYLPQPSPDAVYTKYVEWLVAGDFDPSIDIFTPESQAYLASFRMTNAYFYFLLMSEYGRQYTIATRGNTVLLSFTDDPLPSPHFFIRGEKGWQMDIVAEIRNTRNRVGGVYTWDYRGRDDIYSTTFADKLINVNNYIRIADGDNRELPIRGR